MSVKIVAILILGYFALGFLSTGFLIEAAVAKPKKANALKPETPPMQIPLVALLVAIFLSLPVVGYIRARKQGKFLHLGEKVWLWGPAGLFVLGVVTAIVTHLAAPKFWVS